MMELTLHVTAPDATTPESMEEALSSALARVPEVAERRMTFPGSGRSVVVEAVVGTAAVLTVTLPAIQLLTRNIRATGAAVDALLEIIPKFKALFSELGYGAEIEVGTRRIELAKASRPEAERIVASQERIQGSWSRATSAPVARSPAPSEGPLTLATDGTTTRPAGRGPDQPESWLDLLAEQSSSAPNIRSLACTR